METNKKNPSLRQGSNDDEANLQRVVTTGLFCTGRSRNGAGLVAMKYVFPAGEKPALPHHEVMNFGI